MNRFARTLSIVGITCVLTMAASSIAAAGADRSVGTDASRQSRRIEGALRPAQSEGRVYENSKWTGQEFNWGEFFYWLTYRSKYFFVN